MGRTVGKLKKTRRTDCAGEFERGKKEEFETLEREPRMETAKSPHFEDFEFRDSSEQKGTKNYTNLENALHRILATNFSVTPQRKAEIFICFPSKKAKFYVEESSEENLFS